MDARATELWAHAPAIIAKLEAAIKQNSPAAREELLAVLGIDGGPLTVEDAKPGIDDFEYALQAAVLDRLEPHADPAQAKEREAQVPRAMELAADVVAALFEYSAAPEVSAAETDRCKSWWMIFVQIAEETTKLVSLGQLEKLVEVFERSLLKLRKASLALAAQRLKEFDAKQEADMKAAKETSEEKKSEARAAKDAKERETKRLDERKKLISQLGVSPNGHVFLTMTSLLKQLSSRLVGSFNCRLRAQISLLLERLLALDHKAIANNQKTRAQDFYTVDDLDIDVKALPYSLDVSEASSVPEVVPAPAEKESDQTQSEPAPAEAAAEAGTNGSSPAEEKFSSLGHDPNLGYNDYTGFWALQESLQVAEKLFEKPENWKHFHGAMTKLLKQFEKYPTSAEQREPWTPPEAAPQRQVARARAFRVQMDDPQLRIQFLTQVLIAFQALEQDVTSRRDRPGGLISTQPDSIYAQLKEIRSCIEKVLTQTRASVGTMVTHVLARESHWVNWKGQGCREWEHDSLEMLTGKVQEIDAVGNAVSFPKSDKPKLESSILNLLKEVKDFTPPVVQSPRIDGEGNPEPCALEIRRLGERALDRHEEDEDPANGIEDEYKAKYNKAFMWQSRRLFGRHHIRVYARKEVSGKTDFMDFVRSARNRNPPPEPAKEPVEAAAPATAAAAAATAPAAAAAPGEAPAVAEVLEAAVAAAEAVATDAAPGGGGEEPAPATEAPPPAATAPAEAPGPEAEAPPAAAVLDDGYGPPVDEVTQPPAKKARTDP